VEVTRGSQLDAWIVMRENQGPSQQNDKLSHGLGAKKGWLSPEGFLAPEKGHIGFVLSVPLP